ncbi:MAG: TonB-dependent receptor [Bryobacterales bacterium]|nr:TonB-dependent receptor [Bryobacterales bacterium]
MRARVIWAAWPFRAAALLVAIVVSAAAQDRVALEGRVIDGTGVPIPGASVFIRDIATGLETSQGSGPQGEFSLELRPGTYRVSAAENDFQTVSEEVEVVDRPPEPVVLTLRPAILTQSIIVTGSREQELVETSVAKVEMIARSQLRDSGYESVSDILSEEPGVVTRTSRSPGSRAGTQIHGIDSRQSLILIDGFPVVGARGVKGGILNMNRQSTNRLERVEIVKGASSALYGSDAIGGVINMITREPRQRFDADVTASAASLGGVDLRADSGFVHGRWSGFFAAERHKRNPYDLTPQDIDTTGPGFRRYDYMGKLSREFSENLKVGLIANAFDNRQASVFAGGTGAQVTTTNDSAQNYGATLNAGFSAVTQLQARAYYGKYDENSEVDLRAVPGPFEGKANLNERLYRFDASLSHVLGNRQLLQGGFDWTSNEYRGYNRLVGDNNGQSIRMADAWFQDRIQAHPRLSLTVGGRATNHSAYGSQMVPRVGLMYRATDGLRVRASFGQGFRAPDLGQLYYRFLTTSGIYQIIGNPSLRPELSSTTQVGFDSNVGRLRFGVTYFRNDIRNLIQTELVGRPRTPEQLGAILTEFGIGSAFSPGLNRLTYLYRNIDNVFTAGLESRAQVRLSDNMIVTSGYTYLDARDKATGGFLSQRHKHHGNFRVWWTTKRLGGLRTNFRGTYLGKWPIVGRRATLIADSYQLWDWYVAKPIRSGFEMYGVIDNLFDSIDSNLDGPDPTFYRADPGRTFRVGLRWTFGVE